MSFSKFKICFATGEYYPTIGGLSKSATRISNMLSNAGFEMHVVVPIEGIETHKIPKPEIENGIKVYRIPIGKDIQKSNGIHLANILRMLDAQLNFDLFHGFFLPMAFACTLTIRKKPRPLVTSIRGSDARTWSDPNMSNLFGVILRHTTHFTTVNRTLIKNLFQGRENIIPIKFIRNSIELQSHKKWEVKNLSKGIIGTLGKFQQCKEIAILLESYSRIYSDRRTQLILIGDFPSKDLKVQNQKLQTSLGLNNQVLTTGLVNRNDVVNHLSNLSVFVSTSSSEGFPNALLEAASLGIPIVVANFEGIHDYCEDGKNALIVPIGDVNATSEAISSILKNESLAIKLSLGAIELAKSLSPEIEETQWIELYKELLNGKTKTKLISNSYV